MLKQIALISLLSVFLPLLYLTGWVASIPGLNSFPGWLYFAWPSAIMLMGFGGEPSPLGFEFVVVSFLSLLVNAGIWCMVLVPIWRLIGKWLKRGSDRSGTGLAK